MRFTLTVPLFQHAIIPVFHHSVRVQKVVTSKYCGEFHFHYLLKFPNLLMMTNVTGVRYILPGMTVFTHVHLDNVIGVASETVYFDRKSPSLP